MTGSGVIGGILIGLWEASLELKDGDDVVSALVERLKWGVVGGSAVWL